MPLAGGSTFRIAETPDEPASGRLVPRRAIEALEASRAAFRKPSLRHNQF
jgi:hypothetical protein